MTTYQLTKTLTAEQMETFTRAGILKSNVSRYVYIYEMWTELLRMGRSKMEAYDEIGRKCFTCEDNVRKIVSYMQKEW